MRARQASAVALRAACQTDAASFVLTRWWLAVLLGAACFIASSSAAAADLSDAAEKFRTGQYADCVTAAIAACEESPGQESAWILRMRAELTLGRYADAVKSLDLGLEQLKFSLHLRWLGIQACRFAGQADRAARLETEMAELLKESPWRYSDSVNQVLIGRWMLRQRVDAKHVLSNVFNEVKRQRPGFTDVWLAIGDLALAKHDYLLAGNAFQQAVKLDSQSPDAHFGVAQAFAPSDSEKAEAALQAALKLNPRHVPSLLFVAEEQIDAERYDAADKILAQVAEVNPREPAALAYRAVLAHLRNQPESEKAHRAAALASWEKNPAVDHLIGRKLSQKYRFSAGAAYQRQALAFDPLLLEAKAQLAQDLLRLGQEEEGLRLAEEVHVADGYNIFAYNLVTLQEQLAKFRTLEAEGIQVRMDAREAEIYGPRVLELLQRAKTTLSKKYDVKLPEPVIVEMFPRQQDFAIRTFGLPGGAGFLGVCFGTVITATSPAAHGASPSCWEATLWHEFCHSITLTKTHNKMPRWLSEGISVYEERQENPTWGQAITPQYRAMLLGDDLTPVSQLSGAFLRPKSPLHLQFAYFEAALVVEYLVEKYGREMLLRVLDDLGVGMPINESLARYTGSIQALDDEFAKFARERAAALAPAADWSAPELPRHAPLDVLTAYVKEHPHNYGALGRLAAAQLAAKQLEAAKQTLAQMHQLYPHDASSNGPLALLAQIQRQEGDEKAERATLRSLAELTARDLGTFDRLSQLAAAAGDWEECRRYAERSLAVNPLVPATHRRAAEAAEKINLRERALASYRALLLLEPFDVAEIHFRLATLLSEQGDRAAARRHVLLALEETPRYRAAQQLLLKLTEDSPAPVPAPEDVPAAKPAEKSR